MSLSVVFDEYSLPEKGEHINLEVKRTFSINLSADEAQKKVKHWLFMDVSMMLAAGEPTLAISRHAVVWRVPAMLYSTQQGLLGEVGRVDVNVQTGEMYNTPECQDKIENATESLMAELPPFQLKSNDMIPPECILDDISDIPILAWDDDDEQEGEDMQEDEYIMPSPQPFKPGLMPVG
ncbi:MAG: hypothetical protein AAF639_22010 [Chloroflexota bacterium]